MIKAVVFDIDGTLVDHDKAQRAALTRLYNLAAEKLAKRPPLEEFASVWHTETERYIDMYLVGQLTYREQRIQRVGSIFARWGHTLSEAQAWEVFTGYLTWYEGEWSLFEDALPCLRALGQYRLGVISNGDSKQQRRKLQETGIDSFFASVVVSGDDRIAKPDRGIFQRSSQELETQPSQMVYVGDRLEHDAIGACNAGLNGVWLDRNNSEAQCGNVAKIASLMELPGIIEGL
jgi:putative hydrolase of the HAD superfamily